MVRSFSLFPCLFHCLTTAAPSNSPLTGKVLDERLGAQPQDPREDERGSEEEHVGKPGRTGGYRSTERPRGPAGAGGGERRGARGGRGGDDEHGFEVRKKERNPSLVFFFLEK